ncbi:hypothetical protein FHR90_002854 [Endobacter medicaginis]|uniref:Uncharacterized protein n=1 Tax=Endobacter medicaginis TaxID=1181271 RepID=A0A850NS75_9PROT|nr:hypothetical protein [Endobacter medicaginis]MBB3175007.1 hypothetical protein [Endobacter medicaginis]MCX5475929.1 hypothetical protein [Endobacter medicaginis]NVN28857.1 hypothetical protein [Endobacter medicaginis]
MSLTRRLTPAQHQIYSAGWQPDARFRVAVCGRRFGKALDVETLIPIPGGFRRMAEIEVGDVLFDETGALCRVTAVTGVMLDRPCREVAFSDGSRIVCDVDHLWPVTINNAVTRVAETGDIADMLDRGAYCAVATAAPVMRRSLKGRQRELRKVICRDGRFVDGRIVLDGRRQDLVTLAASCGVVVMLKGDDSIIDTDPDAHLSRRVVSVTTVVSRAVRCLQVDSPSSQYLCGEQFIPTHNTFLIGEELRRAVRLAVAHRVPTENEIWYGAPNFLQARRVMWGRLKTVLPREWMAAKPSESTCSITLVSGHRVRVVGLDAHDSLRGAGLWFFAGDEWADTRPEAWSETIRPMLSTSEGHALFVGTPKGHNHFHEFYRRGLDGGRDDHRSFRFTTEEGGQVSARELADARELLDARTYRQEYEASFESFAGRVLYGFSREHSVRPAPRADDGRIHVGMDFNVNPMTATIWQQAGTALWQTGEIVLGTSNTDEMVSVLRSRHGRLRHDGVVSVEHISVYPDPAGQQRRSSAFGRTDISILREAGFKVCAMSSHPSLRDRVNVMNRLFEAADGTRSAFVDPSCVKSIDAYTKLAYVDDGNQIDKSSGHDHLADASGYFLYWWGTRRDGQALAVPTFMGR